MACLCELNVNIYLQFMPTFSTIFAHIFNIMKNDTIITTKKPKSQQAKTQNKPISATKTDIWQPNPLHNRPDTCVYSDWKQDND